MRFPLFLLSLYSAFQSRSKKLHSITQRPLIFVKIISLPFRKEKRAKQRKEFYNQSSLKLLWTIKPIFLLSAAVASCDCVQSRKYPQRWILTSFEKKKSLHKHKPVSSIERTKERNCFKIYRKNLFFSGRTKERSDDREKVLRCILSMNTLLLRKFLYLTKLWSPTKKLKNIQWSN